jgi:hypothetical protein
MSRSRLIALVGVPLIGTSAMTVHGAMLAVRLYGYDGLNKLTAIGRGEVNGGDSHKSV